MSASVFGLAAASAVLLFAIGAGAIRGLMGMTRIPVSSARMSSMSMTEVVRLLDRIEAAGEATLVYGAMCYDSAMAPLVTEYICPVCGEKTVYPDSGISWPLQELRVVRELFQGLDSVSRLEMVLDETGFCSFCGSGEEQVPVLVITYSDGTEVRSPIGSEDLRMLTGLFSGEYSYESTQDFVLPLRPELAHLRGLLGLESPVR